MGRDHDSSRLMGELEILPRQKSAWGSLALADTIEADDGQLRNNPPEGNPHFSAGYGKGLFSPIRVFKPFSGRDV